jgi:DNA-binding NtrC family response regulator
MNVPWQIVIASSDSNHRRALADILKQQEIVPICTSTVRECRDVLAKEIVGLVSCDPKLTDGGYRDLISEARSVNSRVRLVVTSRQASWDEFLEAMRVGAFDVIAAPCRPKDLEWMIIQAKRDDRSRAKQLFTADPHSLVNSEEPARPKAPARLE